MQGASSLRSNALRAVLACSALLGLLTIISPDSGEVINEAETAAPGSLAAALQSMDGAATPAPTPSPSPNAVTGNGSGNYATSGGGYGASHTTTTSSGGYGASTSTTTGTAQCKDKRSTCSKYKKHCAAMKAIRDMCPKTCISQVSKLPTATKKACQAMLKAKKTSTATRRRRRANTTKKNKNWWWSRCQDRRAKQCAGLAKYCSRVAKIRVLCPRSCIKFINKFAAAEKAYCVKWKNRKKNSRRRRTTKKKVVVKKVVKRVAGPPGPPGPPGKTGKTGKSGKAGKAAKNGKAGKHGKHGKHGKPGKNGKNGKNGKPGKHGKHGKNGTNGKPGKSGKPGKNGKSGPKGKPGKPGKAGKSGPPGPRSKVAGPPGPPGPKGKDGKSPKIAKLDKLAVKSLKADDIYTRTPHGHMKRLSKYLQGVEKKMAKEDLDRKAGLARMKALVMRNEQANRVAMSKLRKVMFAKMKKNAKAQKAALKAALKKTSKAIAKEQASRIASDKRQAAAAAKARRKAEKNLALQVRTWQRAVATLNSTTNAKITRLNKHAAANAAQIKANAAKANLAVRKLASSFGRKLRHAQTRNKKAMRALGARLTAANAATRRYVSEKIAGLVALNVARFQHARSKLAARRHEVDVQLMHSSSRLQATLNAERALKDPIFSASIPHVGRARRTAARLVQTATREFRVSIAALGALVRDQTAKLMLQKQQLAGAVPSSTRLDAKVASVSRAEMMRMIRLGDARYMELKKDDPELHKLVSDGKAETVNTLTKMADAFNLQLSQIRHRMAQHRTKAKALLISATQNLYVALTSTSRHGPKRKATEKRFVKEVRRLGARVINTGRKLSRKIARLTGVVWQKEVKTYQGRELLRLQRSANQAWMRLAIADAVRQGERRGLAGLKKQNKFKKKSQTHTQHLTACNAISILRRKVAVTLSALRLTTAGVRRRLREERLYSIRSAARSAIRHLAATSRLAMATFASLERSKIVRGKAARGVAAKKAALKRNHAVHALGDAVSSAHRARLALQQEKGRSVAFTNKSVLALGERMAANARAADKAVMGKVMNLIGALGKKRAKIRAVAKTNAAAKGADQVMKAVQRALVTAAKRSSKQFTQTYLRMAKARGTTDAALGRATAELHRAMALHYAANQGRVAKGAKAKARIARTLR